MVPEVDPEATDVEMLSGVPTAEAEVVEADAEYLEDSKDWWPPSHHDVIERIRRGVAEELFPWTPSPESHSDEGDFSPHWGSPSPANDDEGVDAKTVPVPKRLRTV